MKSRLGGRACAACARLGLCADEPGDAGPGRKIGLTTKTPKARAVELTAATGVPMPFKVEWRYRCAGASIRLRRIRTTSIRPLSVTR